MAPHPHDIGLHYLYVTSMHSYLPLSDSRAQAPTLCTLLPVTMLAVNDTLYPVHTHLLDGMRPQHRAKVHLWQRTWPLLVLAVPAPFAFDSVLCYHVYGCRCDGCVAAGGTVAATRICDALGWRAETPGSARQFSA
jgi:hypothetical protein